MNTECDVLIQPREVHSYFSESEFTPIPREQPSPGAPTNQYFSCTSKQTVPRVQRVLTIELDRENDARWIAEVLELPGALVYGASREEAISRVQTLSSSILADQRPQVTPRSSAAYYLFQIKHA
jgi:hypothetical protein